MAKNKTNGAETPTKGDPRLGALSAIARGLNGLLKNKKFSAEVRPHIETLRDIAEAALEKR